MWSHAISDSCVQELTNMSHRLVLRQVIEQDLPELFAQQLEYAAVPDDRSAFDMRWSKILGNPDVKVRTIVANEQVVGYLAQFHRSGKPEVSYCIGKQYWGNGFATYALRQFLGEVNIRPLYARVAKDNIRSSRVLDKCGFAIVGEDRFTDAGGRVVEEYLFALAAASSSTP